MERGVATTGELTEEQAILLDGDAGAEEYLLTSWFYRAMEAIRDARLANGVTQQAIADALGTTQSVVARLENAHRGTFSLERFLRYAWASGAAPLDFEHVPPTLLSRLAARDPAAPRTGSAVHVRRLADALGMGRLKVDADVTWHVGDDQPRTYFMSFDSLGNAAGGANSWAGGTSALVPSYRGAVEASNELVAGSVVARTGRAEDGRGGDVPSLATRTAA